MAQYYNWGVWATTTISGATLGDGAQLQTAALSLNNTIAARISVEFTYGATKNNDLVGRILGEIDAAVYETPENAFSFSIAGDASETHRRLIEIPVSKYVNPIIEIDNPTGSSVTGLTVRVSTAVLDNS